MVNHIFGDGDYPHQAQTSLKRIFFVGSSVVPFIALHNTGLHLVIIFFLIKYCDAVCASGFFVLFCFYFI